MSTFKVQHQSTPHAAHVYCRLYVDTAPNQTWAACGNFTVHRAELDDLRAAMPGVTFEDVTGRVLDSTS